MGKQFFWGMINFLKRFFGSIGGFLFKPGMREDGKWMNPRYLKRGPIIAAIAGFAMLFVYKNFIAPEGAVQGFNNFEKEITIKHGQGGVANINEIAEMDEMEMLRLREQQALEAAGLAEPGNPGGVTIDPATGLPVASSVLTPERCQILIDRVVAGEKLEGQDQKDLMECLNQNITGLSDLQKRAIEALADPDGKLTDKEKELLRQVANGDITSDDDPRLKLAEALLGDDPLKKKAARMLINNDDLTDKEREKLMKFLGDELTPEEIEELKNGLLRKPIQGVANSAGLPGEEGYSPDPDGEEKRFSDSAGDSGKSATEQLKELAQEISRADQQIKSLEEELEQGEPEFKRILQKMADGEELSEEEKRFFEEYQAKKEKLKRLKEEQKKRKERFAELSEKAKRELLESQALVKSTLAPGETLAADSYLECSELEKIVTKKTVKKPKKRSKRTVAKKPGIRPDLLRLYEKLNGRDMLADLSPVDPTQLEKAQLSASSFYIQQAQVDRSLKLPPTLKIAALLEDPIWVSEGSSGNPVNIRIVQDIKDPLTNETIITKHSLAAGTLGSFDPDAENIPVDISQVVVGNETRDISFRVIIPGKVKHTRGEQLGALMLTEFASGVAEFFRSQAEREFSDAEILSNALAGSGAGAATRAGERITEFLAQDLRNVKRIFYAPPGIPLVLYPR